MQPLNKSLKLFHVSTQLSTAAYFTWLLLVSVLTHIEHVHFISLALVTFRFIIIFGQVVVRILRFFFHSSNITFFWCNLSETGIYICWVNVYLLFPFSSSYQFFALSFCAFVKLSLPLSLSLYLQLMVNQEKSNFGLLMPKDPVSSRWQFMDKHSLGKIQCKLFVFGEDILRSPHFLRPTSNWLSNRQRRSTRRSIRHESINNSDLNVNSANKVYVKGFKFHFPCNLAAWSNRIKLWLVALSFHVDTQPQL